MRPNFELITEVLPVHRRDFELAVPDLLNPLNSNPLVDGEWLELNASYQAARGTGAGTHLSMPVWSERGRYDTQAINKAPLLMGGFYEAETAVFTLGSLAVGDFLVVDDVTFESLTRKGLIEAAGSGQHMVVGIVTRLPANGRLRFYHNGMNQITIP